MNKTKEPAQECNKRSLIAEVETVLDLRRLIESFTDECPVCDNEGGALHVVYIQGKSEAWLEVS